MRRSRRVALAGFWCACVTAACAWAVSACSGWDPLDPFMHNAPEVDDAIDMLDAGAFESAEEALAHYLGTGACTDAGIGLPESVRQKPNGSFDLGLTLFHIAEKYGRRFGDEESDAGPAGQDELAAQRGIEVDCALLIVKAIAGDPKVPLDLRARAYYLAGNLEFLRKKYKEAVTLYDMALTIVPGLPEDAAVDGIGRDAAHNRAIALRRLEDQDAGQDAGNDGDSGGEDGGDDAADGSDGSDGAGPNDAEADANGQGDGGDGGDDDGPDPASQGPDGGDAGQDAGRDAGRDASNDDKGDASRPEDANRGDKLKASPQDERMLERLGEAPSYQQQEAKARALRRRRRTMEDK